jgi:hypothetical protein
MACSEILQTAFAAKDAKDGKVMRFCLLRRFSVAQHRSR